jgi:hypothetical protein
VITKEANGVKWVNRRKDMWLIQQVSASGTGDG